MVSMDGLRDGAPEPELIDLLHLGRAQVIGAWRVGEVIVDPGPSSCLDRLLPTLERDPPRALALTHIHLDHAGASGTLARRFPELEVWVHPRGAPHLADPSRLLASAERLYGDRMQRLWGEVLAVPAERIRVLDDGELLGGFEVAFTPGHASHHVAYRHQPTGWAFAGDVAGVRIAGGPTMAPTPPPDIDLPAWRNSIELIEGWQPRRLAITHFGAHQDVAAQLEQLRAYLDDAETLARELGPEGFAAAIRARVGSGATVEVAATYEQAMPPDQSYAGLARHLARAEASRITD
jgi:glyoxylase-like metal-dependent hydrolase (beta-lactamase superfamily II)